jgi:hypothetical protein
MAALLFLFSVFSASALGKKEEPVKTGETQGSYPEGIIRLRGRVRLVGSMPLPHLVVSDSAGQDWYVEGADKNSISGYEQQIVTVEGRAEYRDLILANGEKIGVRRLLRDITVLEPEETKSQGDVTVKEQS